VLSVEGKRGLANGFLLGRKVIVSERPMLEGWISCAVVCIGRGNGRSRRDVKVVALFE
jgi:hypothetical protein